MTSLSVLEHQRLSYQPPLPPILRDMKAAIPCIYEGNEVSKQFKSSIFDQFPLTSHQPVITFVEGAAQVASPLKVGVVFSGGQAPGGHNVISGLFDALQKIHPDSQLIGFLDGPQGIIKNQSILLTEEKVGSYRNLGGFDLIGSGRTKIETAEQFEAVERTMRSNGLDGLVIIGGDDSNTNAAFLAEYCLERGLETRIIGVPKTIDGDLRNPFIEISFGFDTASKIYSEVIGNLLKDALSAKKYYFFIKMMGRSASHLTLECALQTKVNLALIGEEIAQRKQTLKDVVEMISDLICERSNAGKDYGAILIPEGIIEFIPECKTMIDELNRLLAGDSEISRQIQQIANPIEIQGIMQGHLSPASAEAFLNLPYDIQQQLLLDRDPHGNIQLSKIETERLLTHLVERELSDRRKEGHYAGKFSPQPLFCGYEGRSGLPTNFDCKYCYALGHVAALLILHGATGYMACLKNLMQSEARWEAIGVPILEMLHFESRGGKEKAVIKRYLVDLEGEAFRALAEERDGWRLNDEYCCSGPVQFCGPSELTEKPPLSLFCIPYS